MTTFGYSASLLEGLLKGGVKVIILNKISQTYFIVGVSR